jgi:hypothetical protein
MDALQFENYKGITMGLILARVFAMIQCLVIYYGKCWLRWELWVASCSVYRTCTARTTSELCIQQKGYQPGSHVALVKEGCPLSPLLFRLYLDGLEKHLDALDGDIPPQLADIVVKLLLYADDLALMLETPQGLQKQIDALSEFCVERQLVINVSKTKVVVFEKHRSAVPKFTYRGTTIERVQSFRYLGLELHSTRGMAVSIAKLTALGRRHCLHYAADAMI